MFVGCTKQRPTFLCDVFTSWFFHMVASVHCFFVELSVQFPMFGLGFLKFLHTDEINTNEGLVIDESFSCSYQKVIPTFQHIDNTLWCHVINIGSEASLYEMMKLFMGLSHSMIVMKHKPIREMMKVLGTVWLQNWLHLPFKHKWQTKMWANDDMLLTWFK